MFDEAGPPGFAPPPPPGTGAAARYVYLLSRLRSRQITMEEATELFAMQQEMIRRAGGRPAPPPPAPAAPGAPSATAPPPPVATLPADDQLWLGLLAMGAGAGVLAAVLKRAREGPPQERPGAGATGKGSGTSG